MNRVGGEVERKGGKPVQRIRRRQPWFMSDHLVRKASTARPPALRASAPRLPPTPKATPSLPAAPISLPPSPPPLLRTLDESTPSSRTTTSHLPTTLSPPCAPPPATGSQGGLYAARRRGRATLENRGEYFGSKPSAMSEGASGGRCSDAAL